MWKGCSNEKDYDVDAAIVCFCLIDRLHGDVASDVMMHDGI